MCGTAEVAMAGSVGSLGYRAIDDGEKATQAQESGVRVCDLSVYNS